MKKCLTIRMFLPIKQESEDGESESDYSDDDGQMRDEDSHDDSGQDSSQDSEDDETERKDDETYSEYQQRLKDLEEEKNLKKEMMKSSMSHKKCKMMISVLLIENLKNQFNN